MNKKKHKIKYKYTPEDLIRAWEIFIDEWPNSKIKVHHLGYIAEEVYGKSSRDIMILTSEEGLNKFNELIEKEYLNVTKEKCSFTPRTSQKL